MILSTAAGRDFDVQRMTTSNAGIALHTREDSLIFMPYDVIEHIEVSIAQDRRVEVFEIPTESDFGSALIFAASVRQLAWLRSARGSPRVPVHLVPVDP